QGARMHTGVSVEAAPVETDLCAATTPTQTAAYAPNQYPSVYTILDHALASLRSLEDDCVIILDGLDPVLDSMDTTESLGWLIGRLPANVHLILISRAFPHVGLSRMRMEGRLLELPASNLAFTPMETASYCQVAGIDVTVDQAQVIHQRTNGWCMALRLFSYAWDTLNPSSQNVESPYLWKAFYHAVYDYLYDEVFRHMPSTLQSFAVVASCLDEFSDSLMAFVLRWTLDDAKYCLATLIDQDIVAQTRTDEAGRGFYAVPALVRDALRGRGSLAAGYRQKDVMARAHSWYLQQQDYDRAIRCAASAGLWDLTADVVLQRWRILHAQDQLSLLHNWTALLPESYIDSHPKLCIISALPSFLMGKQELAFSRLRKAQEALWDADDQTTGLFYAIRCLCHSYSNPQQAASDAARALELLPESEYHFKAMALQVIGGARAFCQPAEACDLFHQSVKQLQWTGYSSPLLSACSNAAFISAYAGFISQASQYSQMAHDLMDHLDQQDRPMLVFSEAADAYAAFVTTDLDSARRLIPDLISHLDPFQTPSVIAGSLVLAAQAAHLGGEPDQETDAARRAFREDPAWAMRAFPPLTLLSHWIKQGIVYPARTLDSLNDQGDCPMTTLLSTAVRFAADNQDYPEMLQGLASCRDAFDQCPLPLIYLGILSAAIFEASGDQPHAEASLAAAFSVAQSQGIISPFSLDMNLIKAPWERLSRKDKTSWAARILKSTPVSAPTRNSDDLLRLLSDRELEVIRLAAAGLTTQEIASRLFVSRDTAKKHLGNVYAKLGVHTKLQAVGTLRQAGLL
ncbi:MAG: LuxR C-terminal-related transcriptional regulator, partial [Eggerthellales bacterium]|nr:LuxR C-terminal-related transcriptional regulator [Eggerthellales bacterium]